MSVSILPVISKIFGQLMNNKPSTYFEKTYSKFQCGFRKSFSTQHCLLLMIKNWKHAVDKLSELLWYIKSEPTKHFKDNIDHDFLQRI